MDKDTSPGVRFERANSAFAMTAVFSVCLDGVVTASHLPQESSGRIRRSRC